MLAKKTTKNQLTLPKEVIRNFPGVDYFNVYEEDGRIILDPLVPSRAEEVRRRLEALGITEDDVTEAIEWARRQAP